MGHLPTRPGPVATIAACLYAACLYMGPIRLLDQRGLLLDFVPVFRHRAGQYNWIDAIFFED
jgi:hypothetical protein